MVAATDGKQYDCTFTSWHNMTVATAPLQQFSMAVSANAQVSQMAPFPSREKSPHNQAPPLLNLSLFRWQTLPTLQNAEVAGRHPLKTMDASCCLGHPFSTDGDTSLL